MYHTDTQIVCICGVTHTISSPVKGPVKVETCKACHSTYTGKMELKLTKGRAEKFEERLRKMEAAKVASAKTA
jgi:large subunit ribosomal protein L31